MKEHQTSSQFLKLLFMCKASVLSKDVQSLHMAHRYYVKVGLWSTTPFAQKCTAILSNHAAFLMRIYVEAVTTSSSFKLMIRLMRDRLNVEKSIVDLMILSIEKVDQWSRDSWARGFIMLPCRVFWCILHLMILWPGHLCWRQMVSCRQCEAEGRSWIISFQVHQIEILWSFGPQVPGTLLWFWCFRAAICGWIQVQLEFLHMNVAPCMYPYTFKPW